MLAAEDREELLSQLNPSGVNITSAWYVYGIGGDICRGALFDQMLQFVVINIV